MVKLPPVLIERKQIDSRIAELGEQLSADYAGKDPVVICTLKGAAVFCADLIRKIAIPMELDFLRAASYEGKTQKRTLQIQQLVGNFYAGRNLLIVEDIVDSGRTISEVVKRLEQQKPASIAVCTLLDKPAQRQYTVDVRYCGFEIPDRFVVGYGLDYKQRYRNLPYIGYLDDEIGE